MQWSSDLSAGRTRANAGQTEERLPNPSLKKVGWYAGVIVGVALLALLSRDLFGNSASVDVGALHSALTMVALGVSLTITGIALLLYGWAGLRLVQRFKRDREATFTIRAQ
ncbi:MAG: hypothetical protein HY067_15105 [Betaproteobacteria bacterium]|nr:hypothetical protein [Betaproteobacteria bacterium]